MSAPRISVVLPSHEGMEYLAESVASVLCQTEPDFELILVNDGSRDGTGEAMDDWARQDSRVRVVHLAPNRGLPAALNAGFREARGELLTWTSDDNLYAPEALAHLARHLDEHPDVDFAFADYVRFGAGPEQTVRVGPVRALPFQNVVGACFLYRRAVHEALGGYDESLPLAEDYDFWLRASAAFRLDPIHRPLYRYRDQPGSLSVTRRLEARRAAWRAVERQLPNLTAEARARVRLHWADRMTAAGHPDEARENLRDGLDSAPAAWRPSFRRALARSMIGRTAFERPLPGDAPRFILPSHLGGVTSYVLDRCALPEFEERDTRVLWLDSEVPGQSPAVLPEVPRQARTAHRWPGENLFGVLRRMHRTLGPGTGPIFACELFGLAYAARHAGEAPVIQILHGDLPMYYRLAEDFAPWVDAFVAVSRRVAEQAAHRLPHRADDVHLLPNAVPVPDAGRRGPMPGEPLRLVYAGRIEARKGVLDLPKIDRRLHEAGVPVVWTLIGSGPDEEALRDAFDARAKVEWTGALSREACRERIGRHDVFVLPSHAEGLPLALLEAMGAGVVPVVSDLESGVRDVVEDGVNGFLATPERPDEFAAAISQLHARRDRLEAAGLAARETVVGGYALDQHGPALLHLADDLACAGPHVRPAWRRGPSRLDRPWLPNGLVRLVRSVTR